MNPDKQIEVCRNLDCCFFDKYPTLKDVDVVYGEGESSSWIINMIENIEVYCGCKGKLTSEQYSQLADIISTENPDMKISEFMLFCLRFKSAKYGRFYGNVDPMIIMDALNRFKVEIKSEKYRMMQEKREKESKEKENNDDGIYYEEWCKMIGRDPNQKIEFKGLATSPAKKEHRKFSEKPEDILAQAKSIVSELNESIRNTMSKFFFSKHKTTPSEYIKNYK